jgi:hypothetical protein
MKKRVKRHGTRTTLYEPREHFTEGLARYGTNKDGTDDTDLATKTIKQDPEAAEAALILHKKPKKHVNSEPEPEF